MSIRAGLRPMARLLGGPPVVVAEGFLGYTEVDPNNKLSQTVPRASFASVIRDEACYLYKDYGAAYFTGAFEHLIDVHVTDLEAGDTSDRPSIILYGVASTYGTDAMIRSAGVKYIIILVKQRAANDDQYYFQIQGSPFGVGNADTDSVQRNAGDTWYLTIARAGDDTITCTIYQNAARTIVSGTITLPTDVTEALRYLTVTSSIHDARDPDDWVSGYVENLVL